MAQRSVGLFFEEGVPSDDFHLIEVGFWVVGPLGTEVPLAVITGAIVVFTKNVGVEDGHGFGGRPISVAGVAIASGGESGENGGAAGPANRVADESLLETSAAFGESVDIWGLNNGVSVAAQGADSLIVGEKEDDVGFFGSEGCTRCEE